MLELYIISFNVVLFKVGWYMLHMNAHDLDGTIIEHVNEFTVINTRLLDLVTKTYVLPSKCEKLL